MGSIKPFCREKLVIGIIINTNHVKFDDVKHTLEKLFGPVDYETPSMPFNYTEYYNEEMDTPLTRYFISFKNLIDPENLSEIKIATNDLEDSSYSRQGKRYVNLDPGILCLSRLILASSKNFSHRIHLKKGIYGEVTLLYQNKKWHVLPWTFPDYQSKEYQSVLSKIREIFKDQLKEEEI